jgi:hypothetical protein
MKFFQLAGEGVNILVGEAVWSAAGSAAPRRFGMEGVSVSCGKRCRRSTLPPQSKTLARWPMTLEPREASWSAPALWRFSSERRCTMFNTSSGQPRSLTEIFLSGLMCLNCARTSDGGMMTV